LKAKELEEMRFMVKLLYLYCIFTIPSHQLSYNLCSYYYTAADRREVALPHKGRC